MTHRPTLDVSGLPASAYDSRSPAWWGNSLFMAIETTTVALLLASYFYLWRNFPQSLWPPPRVDVEPPILHPVPDLGLATVTTVLLVATVPLMAWLNQACGRQFDRLERLQSSKPSDVPADVPEAERPEARPRGVMLALVAMTLLTALAAFLRWKEFPGLKFSWNDNAYAALVWTALGLHLLYIAVEAIEMAVMVLWTGVYGLGQNQCGDVVLTGYYWFWTVAVGVVIYAVVYWFPRVA